VCNPVQTKAVNALPTAATPAAFISIVARVVVGCLLALAPPAWAQREMVDAALVLAVDVSGSVTPERFALQMEGIARAFEDASVERAVLSGPHRSIFVTLVEWSNRPAVSVPWTLITDGESARAFAARIRDARRADDQFTCMSAALQMIGGKVLPFLPAPATRTIIDVSGDGHDNCNPVKPVDAVRDELVGAGATINGLPILEGEEADTLEQWYRNHVIGGQNAFLLPASGFRDFGRAIRAKFVLEISFLAQPFRATSAD
jgi:Protein of unknown function (DUF1194)